MDIVLSSVSMTTETSSLNSSSEVPTAKELAEKLNEEIVRVVLPTLVFVGAEMMCGFVGNLLVLYVFSFRYHVCNNKYFVLNLAVIDILTTFTTMPGEIITQRYWYVYHVNLLCKVKSFCNVFTLTAEALCLLAIAIDRYRKVCRPLAWQIKTKHAKLICLGLPVVAYLIALPTPFLWGERTLMKTYKNYTVEVTICEKDDDFESTNYPLIYISIVSGVVFTILAVMFFSYVYILGELVSERRRSKRLNQIHEMVSTPPITKSPPSETTDRTTSADEASDSGVRTTCDSSSTSTPFGPSPLIVPNASQENLESVLILKHAKNTVTSMRVRRKTLIMFIVTLAFIVTTLVYLVLVSIIASADDILQQMSDASKAAYFFFLRLYFINHVINPFIYGVLDQHFKETMRKFVKCMT